MMRRLASRQPLASASAAHASHDRLEGFRRRSWRDRPRGRMRNARRGPARSRGTRPISASPSSVLRRRTRMFSAGRRSHTGSNRPAASQNRDSRCDGRPAISSSQSELPFRFGRFLASWRRLELGLRHGVPPGGTQQADSAPARRRRRTAPGRGRKHDRGAVGPGIDHQYRPAVRVLADFERAPSADVRLQPVPAHDLDQLGGGSRCRDCRIKGLPAGRLPGSRPCTVSTPTS